LGSHPTLASALSSARARVSRVNGTRAFGIAVISPLMLAAAVGAAGPSFSALSATPPVRDADVTPLAAVAPVPPDMTGPTVVAIRRTPTDFHIAAATQSAPPPAIVVTSPGAMRIPTMALSAYRNAEMMMARAYPACGISWNLLAGIGRIESGHANGGATDARGNPSRPIYGPALDGTLPGNEIIVAGSQAGRVNYARALGPMQFLPGTWSRYASDGDGDGKADPQNLYDSSLAAARYLCSGNLNLRDPSQVNTAILRYNNSVAYVRNVLGWAGAYATGVEPVDLPPINGPVPAMGNAHMDNAEGLGPGLPMNAGGLPAGDPLSRLTIFDLGQSDVANRLPVPPGPATDGAQTAPLTSPCTIFCISDPSAPPPSALLPAPEGLPGLPPPPLDAAPVPPAPQGLPGLPPPFNPFAPPPAPEPVPAPVVPVVPVPGPAPGPVGPAPGPAA
jgi:membrane-bound lytic murein transglycosylase B